MLTKLENQKSNQEVKEESDENNDHKDPAVSEDKRSVNEKQKKTRKKATNP